MRIEVADRRILGALRCVDGVTDLPIAMPLQVAAPGLRLTPGPRGLLVIQGAPGLAALKEISIPFLEQPSDPPPGQTWPVPITLSLRETSGRYLPRQVTIQLPREPEASEGSSLFDAQPIRLYPAPAGPIAAGWAVLRATVLDVSTGAPRRLPWAWLRVLQSSASGGPPSSIPLALAMADGRGEALIAVRTLPLSFGVGGSRRMDLPVLIEVVVDSRLPDLPEQLNGEPLPEAISAYLPDPDLLEGSGPHRRVGRSGVLTLKAGRDPPARVVVNLAAPSP
jgi:hypothetical protein